MKIPRMILGVLFGCFVAVSGYAQEEGVEEKGSGSHFERMMDGVTQGLGLTAQQQEQLQQNRKLQREKIAVLRKELKGKWTRLNDALRDPKVTKDSVQPLLAELKSVHSQIIDARIDGILRVRTILTPEQYEKFQKFALERKEKNKGRFQERMREKRQKYESEE